jgi:hypothetical protein
MEMLDPQEVERERTGICADGVRWFPRAVPRKMLRIFRTRFTSLARAWEEVERVKLVETCLGPDFLAVSQEFLVDYEAPSGCDTLLCGVQEYVPGDPVDPWRTPPFVDSELFATSVRGGADADSGGSRRKARYRRLRASAAEFVRRVKTMIRDLHLIPDLAGARNLIATPAGILKLVDINNISRITEPSDICVDDKGYPVCDKSVEALFLLEKNLVGRSPDPTDEIYAHFLESDRVRRVAAIHRRFHRGAKSCFADF